MKAKETNTQKAELYLNGRWQQQRDYYSKQASRNKHWHQSLVVFGTIGALLVPVLLNISAIPKLIPTVVSVLVSIALALDSLYHFGDNWRSFRQTLEALKQERIYFEAGIGSYVQEENAFTMLVENCEAIMQDEGKHFFEYHRVKRQETGMST